MMETTKPSVLPAHGIARRVAWILLALVAAFVALVELAWHLEILLKLIPG
jgi:hypothetical protein